MACRRGKTVGQHGSDARNFKLKEQTFNTELMDSTLTSRKPAMWTTLCLSSLAYNLKKGTNLVYLCFVCDAGGEENKKIFFKSVFIMEKIN